jgi:hypothetical protein
MAEVEGHQRSFTLGQEILDLLRLDPRTAWSSSTFLRVAADSWSSFLASRFSLLASSLSLRARAVVHDASEPSWKEMVSLWL